MTSARLVAATMVVAMALAATPGAAKIWQPDANNTTNEAAPTGNTEAAPTTPAPTPALVPAPSASQAPAQNAPALPAEPTPPAPPTLGASKPSNTVTHDLPVITPLQGQYIITTAANLRSAPSSKAAIVQAVNPGHLLPVIGQTTDSRGRTWLVVMAQSGVQAFLPKADAAPMTEIDQPVPSAPIRKAALTASLADGSLTVLDAANVMVNGTPVSVSGIVRATDGDEFRTDINQVVAGAGGTLSCTALPPGKVYICSLGNTSNYATTLLLQGFAKVGPGATSSQLQAEASAKARKAGIWNTRN